MFQHVSTLKGSSSGSKIDTFQQQGQQNESPVVKFLKSITSKVIVYHHKKIKCIKLWNSYKIFFKVWWQLLIRTNLVCTLIPQSYSCCVTKYTLWYIPIQCVVCTLILQSYSCCVTKYTLLTKLVCINNSHRTLKICNFMSFSCWIAG
jgi:hypothetical protein